MFSSAIGAFVIGESPIGVSPPPPVPPAPPTPPTPGPTGGFGSGLSALAGSTVISQYAQSPVLGALLNYFEQYFDPSANFNLFFDSVMNIDTATGYGLDVWGRILGVGRVLAITTGNYFGLKGPSSDSGEPFNQAVFYNGQRLTDNFALPDAQYRQLLLAKAAANICSGSIPAINQVLLFLFPGLGNCYCTDGQNMTMTYTFSFALTPVQLAIVFQSGVLPKPAGVALSIVQPA
jgi:hypothetical protein